MRTYEIVSASYLTTGIGRLPHIGDEDRILTHDVYAVRDDRRVWGRPREMVVVRRATGALPSGKRYITDDDRKRAVFLSVIDPKAYQILSSLVAPEKPGDKANDHLIELLAAHYDPPPSEIMQRFKFHTRTRVAGESIATFVAGLRALGQTCGFGAALGDIIMLRDGGIV